MSVLIDRTRIPRTYREFLDTLKSMGEMVEINDEIDWYLELGAIFRRTAETLSPGAIFNKIKGCPSMGFFASADIVVALRKAGLPAIDAMLTFESALHWLVIRVPSDWHSTTGLSVEAFIKKIATTIWTQHVGGTCTKILVVGEDIDPADPNSVTWAFATRNHPTRGTYYFPELDSVGTGLEAYHSVNDLLRGKGGLVVYSCLPLQERIGLPKKRVMSFEKNYPEPIQEKVRANWARWGFEAGKSR